MARKTNYTKNGKDYFRTSLTIGYDEKGRQIKKEFYGESAKEANAKKEAYKRDVENGLDLDLGKQTMAAAMKTWLFEVKKADHDIKDTTFMRYEGVYRVYIAKTQFGQKKVFEVKSLDIQRYINGLDDLTHSQYKNIIKVLKMFFIYATSEGYTAKNPCLKISIPGEKPKKQEVETFTDAEVNRIRETMKGNRLELLINLAFGTGLRKGELLALRYDDIKNGTIKVHASLAKPIRIERDGTRVQEFEVWEPKSAGSVRDVPVPTELLPMLEAHRRKQTEERLAIGLGGKSDYIFTTETGNFIDPTNFTRAFKRILKSAGVPYRKFHACRHTFATQLVRANVPLVTVQKLMGHSTLAMTSIYAHSNLEDKKDAVNALNYMFK